ISLFHSLRPLPRLLRLVLVPILASMLVAMSGAQLRSTVINMQMQAGSTRIYEMHDEPPVRAGVVQVAQQLRHGRRPFEEALIQELPVWPEAPSVIPFTALPPA